MAPIENDPEPLNSQENASTADQLGEAIKTIAQLSQQLADTLAMNKALAQQLKESADGNAELRAILAELQNKIDKLLGQQKKQNREKYGPKSEGLNPRPAVQSNESPIDSQHEIPKPRNHKKHIRLQDLPTLPKPYKVPDAARSCPDCHVETKTIRTQITHQLERLRHSIVRLQHEQEVVACPKCRKYVVTAEKPETPLLRGLPGPCLLASTIVDKLADGLPQYRQSKKFAREAAIIPRSTLCDWFKNGALMLEPLYERLKRSVLESKVVQTDDCPVKIQNRVKRGKMRRGKMTVYRGDDRNPEVAFDFSPDQSFTRNKKFLEDYFGYVQADAAAGFDALYADGSKFEVGCNAHSRRKFYELCDTIIQLYRRLYAIERNIRGKSAAYRLAIRRTQSKAISKKIHNELTRLRASLHPTHPLMDGVNYALNHWVALNRFLKDADLDIDNNAAERAIKDFVLARKNFLFVGSDVAGKAMAISLSFIVSCKRNDIDPVSYLTDVFSRINSMKINELDCLLPHLWSPEQIMQQS